MPSRWRADARRWTRSPICAKVWRTVSPVAVRDTTSLRAKRSSPCRNMLKVVSGTSIMGALLRVTRPLVYSAGLLGADGDRLHLEDLQRLDLHGRLLFGHLVLEIPAEQQA